MLKMARKGVTADDRESLRFDSWDRAGSSLEMPMAHWNSDLVQFNWTNYSVLFKYFAIHVLLIVPGGRSWLCESLWLECDPQTANFCYHQL